MQSSANPFIVHFLQIAKSSLRSTEYTLDSLINILQSNNTDTINKLDAFQELFDYIANVETVDFNTKALFLDTILIPFCQLKGIPLPTASSPTTDTEQALPPAVELTQPIVELTQPIVELTQPTVELTQPTVDTEQVLPPPPPFPPKAFGGGRGGTRRTFGGRCPTDGSGGRGKGRGRGRRGN